MGESIENFLAEPVTLCTRRYMMESHFIYASLASITEIDKSTMRHATPGVRWTVVALISFLPRRPPSTGRSGWRGSHIQFNLFHAPTYCLKFGHGITFLFHRHGSREKWCITALLDGLALPHSPHSRNNADDTISYIARTISSSSLSVFEW